MNVEISDFPQYGWTIETVTYYDRLSYSNRDEIHRAYMTK